LLRDGKVQKEKLEIGLIGCGAISQLAHVPAASRAKHVHFAAICDRDSELLEKVADRAGINRRYADYSEMLASDSIQAVVVAVPDTLHVPLATAALQAGKHVLVEKPLGVSTAECRELVKLVDMTGLKLQVGCMRRHDPGIRFARQHIQERLGSILSFGAVYQDSIFRPAMQQACFDPMIASTRTQKPTSNWKADSRRYNLITQGAHLFDTIRYLVGPISAVRALRAEQKGNYSWHGLLEGQNGSLGHFELTCKSCGDWCEQYKVCGETGSVELDIGLWFYHRPARVRAFDGIDQQWKQPFTGQSNAFANQLDDFAESIFQDRPTDPDARDGLAAVELIAAIETSLETGQRVETGSTSG
jgi:predicted dehydrogenase